MGEVYFANNIIVYVKKDIQHANESILSVYISALALYLLYCLIMFYCCRRLISPVCDEGIMALWTYRQR